MKLNKLILFFIVFLTQHIVAQEVIFQQKNIDHTFDIPRYGPNRAVFCWVRTEFPGLNIASENEDVEPHFLDYWSIDIMSKFKISQIFSYGVSIGYNNQQYLLSDDGKAKFNTENYLKSKVSLNSLNLGSFIRINYDKNRGNFLGWYTDLGGFVQWDFNRKLKSTDKSEKIVSKPSQLENFAAGVEIHVGRNTFGLFAKYKLLSSIKYPDGADKLIYPPLTIGLEFNFYNVY